MADSAITPIDATGWSVVPQNQAKPTPIPADGWTPVDHPTLPPVPIVTPTEKPAEQPKESIPVSAAKDILNVASGTAGMLNTGIMQWINTLYPGKENTIYKIGKALYDEYKAGNLAETELQSAVSLLKPMWEDVKAVAEPISRGEIGEAIETVARKPATYATDILSVAQPLKAGVRRAASLTFGPSAENIAARVAKSGEIKAARPYSVIAQDVPAAMGELDNKINIASKEAIATLSENPADGFSAQKLIEQLEAAKSKVGKVISDADANAIQALERYKKRIVKEYKNGNISPADTKKIIQKLDKDIEWDTPKSDTVNNAIKGLRKNVDAMLKEANPEYGNKMKPLSELMDLHQEASQALGTKRIGGEYVVNRSVENRLANLHKGALKEADKATLNRLADITGYDLVGEAENYRIKELFEKPTTHGARRAVIGGTIGGAIGGVAGGAKGGAIGASIGSAAGGALDVYGGRMLGTAIDTAGKPLRVAAEMINKINPSISLAVIQRGIETERKDHPEIPEEYLPNLVADELKKDPNSYNKERTPHHVKADYKAGHISKEEALKELRETHGFK